MNNGIPHDTLFTADTGAREGRSIPRLTSGYVNDPVYVGRKARVLVLPIKLALYAVSGNVLRQAEKGFSELAQKFKLDMRIKTYAHIKNFTRDLHKYDIAAIHDCMFLMLLPKVNEIIRINKSDAGTCHGIKSTVVGVFKTPIDNRDFVSIMDKLPRFGALLDIPVPRGIKTESVDNILCFEIINRKVNVRTRYETFVTKLSMSDVMELTAGYPFVSPYVSFIVNLEWVDHIIDRDIVLKNNDLIPISQAKAPMFKQAYREYLSRTL